MVSAAAISNPTGLPGMSVPSLQLRGVSTAGKAECSSGPGMQQHVLHGNHFSSSKQNLET